MSMPRLIDKIVRPVNTAIDSTTKRMGTSNDAESNNGHKKFGTFQGVFTPTALTILGVIMYLREGWVVGNAGVGGAILIILLASGITFFTSLSMSSITTNIRIKAGGAFSIISQSLGLEAGGAIGIPLYLAQAFAVALYIFGFREGWLWVFPTHSALIIDLLAFGLIFGIAHISADFAFKIQYVVLAIIVGSLVSIGMAFINQPVNTDIQIFGSYKGSPENNFSGSNFWLVFAVYFPAVTGIMAGANMSGDLENPRQSIPNGTLSAVILCTFIYIALAILLALIATPEELISNYNILIERAFWSPIVLAGLLGATFSSALSSLVGAPRIMYALAENNILIQNKALSKIDHKGEPKNSLYITSILVLLALLVRDLNAIAPILTMFFLITYAMINVVVLIEQGLSQVSFRPTFKVPIVVPLVGAIGCLFAMFIINATVSFIAVGLVMGGYILLMQKKFSSTQGDARSGLFNAMAEWSAKIVNKLPEAKERSWQPNMVVPAHHITDVVRSYKILFSLAKPKGSIKLIGFAEKGRKLTMDKRLEEVKTHFMEAGISCTQAVVEGQNFLTGMISSMQAMKATFFTPNSIFLSLTDDKSDDEEYQVLIENSQNLDYGVYLYVPYEKLGLGLEKTIDLWINSEELSELSEKKPKHLNLAILTSYLLQKNWNATLRINVLLKDTDDEEYYRNQVKNLKILARIPKSAKVNLWHGGLDEAIKAGQRGDINITYIKAEEVSMAEFRQKGQHLQASILYTLDSGIENAFA